MDGSCAGTGTRKCALVGIQSGKGEKYLLVVGNEVHGVDQKIVDMCDNVIEIPQCGAKHSLNVSASAAIALWHLFAAIR